MADANCLIDIQMKKITQVVHRGCKLILSQRIKDKLIEKIFENFYDRYSVGDKGWLIESLSVNVTPVSNMNSFEIDVFWKGNSLKHTTWWGGDSFGLSPFDKVYTVQWINSGQTFLPGGNRRINEVGEVGFIEDAIEELELDRAWINEFYNYLRNNGIDVS